MAHYSPPIFIVHGDADPIVPYAQSFELHKKLNGLGIKTNFIAIPNGLHGKYSDEEKMEINVQMWKFLEDLGL